MTFDRTDFATLTEKAQKDRHRANESNLRAIHHAALRTQYVTGSPLWDTFLTYIEGAIETTQAQLAGWEQKLVDPMLTSDDDMRQAKIQAIICRERIRAWEAVMELPKDLQEAGDKAKDILERLDE